MGHSARLTMESHACPNSTKIDDSTKLEAKEVGSSAVAGELDLNTSPKKELASNEGDGTEASFNPAKDIVQPAALEAESRAFKHEDENERKASSDGTAATVTPSLTEKRNEELLSQSHEIISAVPDIVVEHVPAKDAHSRGLTPPFVVISISNLTPSSSFRQIRALSDSSVHVSHSSYIPPGNTEFRHLQPHIWRSLGDMDETCQLRSKDSDLQEELSLRTGLKKCRISRLSAVIEPDQGDAETFEPVRAEVSASPCHLHSYKSHFRQGKSPKTYWMRRHSDSNLSTPPGSGLRPEPYPVRSRSTGDSVPGAVAPCETAISGVGDKESPRSSMVNEQRGTPDSSERFSPDEKVTGLYKKRLKLKKYLQTRYQTSLREMRQSSDADDVFACSPTLVTSPEPVRMHINVPSVTPAPLSPMSFEVYENRSQRQFLSQQQQGSSPGTCTKELYHEKVGGSSCDPSEPMYRAGVKPGVAMEESLSPASTCSSEVPVFIFPVASTSNLSVSPSSFPRQYSQSLVSPSFTATTLEFEHLAVTSPSGSDVSGLVNSPSRVTSSLSGFHDIHTYQNVASKNPEVPGVSSELPMFVDSPYDKPCPAGYPRQFSPWEASDKHAQILALARPQSHNSLLPYSPGSEPPNYQIARFPSMPVLSDTSPSHWQEFGEVSPVLISSPVIRLASMSLNKSFEAKPGYSQIQEGGVERDDSTLARSQFTCPLCGQEFVSYGLLANHMSSHLPAEGATKDSSAEAQRVHICRVCNRSFSRSDMLTRHARLHTGLRPYECHLCGQVFSRSDHLHTHLRTHTGEKPYKCTYCPYAAPRRDMVTRHMRIHTRDVPHRGRRSSSVSSDVPTSPVYSDLTGLQVEEVELIMMQSLSDIGSLRRSGRDYSRGSAATADVDLGPAQRLVSCRTCSLTSCESTEGSDISHSFPACRAWSSTSTESFESFSSPRTRDQLSWSSSTDSPDVFSRNHQQFFWSARPGYVRPPERSGAPSSTAVDTLSVEMQTSFERCTVTASERDERRHAAKDKCAEVKIKKERKFDSEDDYVI